MDESTGTRFEVLTPDWLELDEALRRVLEAASPLPPVRVPAADAPGHALADDVSARATLPPWDNAAMDGYAVRGDDIAGASPSNPVALRVVDRIQAGDVPSVAVGPGEAARIMTGAPVPPGADSVVRVEDTDAESDEGVVRILRDRDRRRHVRPAGEDAEVGRTVLLSGDPVHPGTVAMLAALGMTDVLVHPRPEVAILATGDELRTPDRYDDVIAGAGVPESNGPMVAAQARSASAEPRYLGIARDEPGSIQARILEGSTADVLVTVGGASMGEADLVKRVLDDMGFELDFWRVKMRPGSTASFGFLPRDDRPPLPVFGLPGNPASAFVTFEILVRPFLLRCGGHRHVHRRWVRAVAGEHLRGRAGQTVFLRVTLDGGEPLPVARLTGPQGSGLVRSLPRAEALAVVPADAADGIPEGEGVAAILLDAGPGATIPSPSW